MLFLHFFHSLYQILTSGNVSVTGMSRDPTSYSWIHIIQPPTWVFNQNSVIVYDFVTFHFCSNNFPTFRSSLRFLRFLYNTSAHLWWLSTFKWKIFSVLVKKGPMVHKRARMTSIYVVLLSTQSGNLWSAWVRDMPCSLTPEKFGPFGIVDLFYKRHRVLIIPHQFHLSQVWIPAVRCIHASTTSLAHTWLMTDANRLLFPVDHWTEITAFLVQLLQSRPSPSAQPFAFCNGHVTRLLRFFFLLSFYLFFFWQSGAINAATKATQFCNYLASIH